MSEQLPEEVAYDTLSGFPDDIELLELIRQNSAEVRYLAIAEDVIADRLPGIPKEITDIWLKAVKIPYKDIHDEHGTFGLNEEPFEEDFTNLTSEQLMDAAFEISLDAYKLKVESGVIVVGGEINNFILRLSEPISGLGVLIKKIPNQPDFSVFSGTDVPLSSLGEIELYDLLQALSGEYPTTKDMNIIEATLWQLQVIGQKYGVSQTEYRVSAQLFPEDGQKADSHEGAVLLVETETPRDSKIELAIQRLQDFTYLDAQVIRHFGAAYSQSGVTKSGLAVDTNNNKIIRTGLGYAICDIDNYRLPAGVVKPLPVDDAELVRVIDALQQVVAAGGDFLLPN